MNNMALKSLSIAIAVTISGQSIAKSVDYQKMQKQLTIMSNVIKTTIAQETTGKGPKISRIDTMYLSGQGAVMTVSSSNRGWSLGGYNFDWSEMSFGSAFAPEPPELPQVPNVAEPVVVIDGEELYANTDLSHVIDEAVEISENAYDYALDQLRRGKDAYRELREKERELAYEKRELDRQKRDLSYRARVDSDTAKKEIEEAKKALEERNKTIEEAKSKLSAKLDEFKKKQAEAKKASAKAKRDYYTQLESQIAEGLCTYGNGLRALPSKENVSVILKSAGDKSSKSRRTKDKVLVFSKSQIKKCIVEDISSTELLAKATRYQF